MRLDINGILYTIEEQGSGARQALFLHDIGGSSGAWHETLSRLEGLRCVAPDLPGLGATPAPDVSYTVDQYAADLLALIETLLLDDFALVGHGMGGKIALALAAQQPSGLRRLVLVAPAPPGPAPLEPAWRRRMLKAQGDRPALEQIVAELAGATLPANLLQQAVEEQLRASETAWRGWLDEGSQEDLSGRVAQISVPVTVIAGERDPLLPPEQITRDITPYLTGTLVRVVVAPEAGHLLPYEAPQTIADALQPPHES